MALLLVSFLAGVLTVLAPCILPLLPVIVGGSFTGEGEASTRRALVIVISLAASVFLFTLALKATTAFIAVPELFWQIVSGALLLFFGFVTLFPSLWDRIPGIQGLYRSSNRMVGRGYMKQSIWGDVVVGAALGPVFSSCSPTYFVILAAVLPAHTATGIAYLAAYSVGLALSLFVIAVLGQKAAGMLGIAADPNGRFKKAIGILFILVGIAVIFGWDKQLEAALPSGAFAEIGIEQNLLSAGTAVKAASSSPATTATSTPASANGFLTDAEKALRYPKAPELVSPDGYINTDGQPVTLAQFKGKDVVLVDFWDYSCINCQRTFPYLKAWYQKYKDEGLVIIGVHTPEFAFEQLKGNVEAAAERFGLAYPIVLDNEYKTWNAFQNQYWPREYLIDIDGYVVHDHAGEGDYDGTEQAIQAALAERAARLGTQAVATTSVSMPEPDLSGVRSPETYFGSARNEYLGNGTPGRTGTQTFTLPDGLPSGNTLYLGGAWDIEPEYAEGSAGSEVLYIYSARDVYLVATPKGKSATIEVSLDGEPAGLSAGADVNAASEATVTENRLYTLIHAASPGIHILRIKVKAGTLDAYTFTFG